MRSTLGLPALAFLLLACGAASAAQIPTGNPCRDDGGIYGAAVRELCAYQQDRRDEIRHVSSKAQRACRVAQLETVLVDALVHGVGLGLSAAVAMDLTERQIELEAADGLSTKPFRDALATVDRSVQLTPNEARALRVIRKRQPQDKIDQLKLLIEVQAFLMRVSDRLYGEEIAKVRARIAKDQDGLFSSDELCTAATLQIRRNEQMIRAAQRILAYYDFLELELTDPSEGMVSPEGVFP